MQLSSTTDGTTAAGRAWSGCEKTTIVDIAIERKRVEVYKSRNQWRLFACALTLCIKMAHTAGEGYHRPPKSLCHPLGGGVAGHPPSSSTRSVGDTRPSSNGQLASLQRFLGIVTVTIFTTCHATCTVPRRSLTALTQGRSLLRCRVRLESSELRRVAQKGIGCGM